MHRRGRREAPAPTEDPGRHQGVDTSGNRMHESARQYWSELTEDDLDGFDGRAEHLSNALRKRYGWSEEEIEAEIEWWEEESGNELV
jgi:uncharacterized protein YjbJ (UPF0337 family)